MYVAFAGVAVFLMRKGRQKQTPTLELMAQLAFAFYLSRVLALTLFPFAIDARMLEAERLEFSQGIGQRNNFVLFQTVRSTWGWTFGRQIIGNLVLLFPLGLLGPLLVDRLRRSPLLSIAVVIVTSIGIELSQLFFSQILGYRFKSFDVDDLWLNSIGGIAGVALSPLLRRRRVGRPTRRSRDRKTDHTLTQWIENSQS